MHEFCQHHPYHNIPEWTSLPLGKLTLSRMLWSLTPQVNVPLENTNPVANGYHSIPNPLEDNDSLLPMTNLTATSLLGGRGPGQETIGQLYARQIASAILTKTPNESRPLVVGLGLLSAEADRDFFFAVVDLVLQCL